VFRTFSYIKAYSANLCLLAHFLSREQCVYVIICNCKQSVQFQSNLKKMKTVSSSYSSLSIFVLLAVFLAQV
jgi:hypothetical protein